MKETLITIMDRRSIRSYKPEQIKETELKNILDAGVYAPSAINQQSWHITAVQNKDIMNRINEICKKLMQSSNNNTFKQRASNPDFNVFYNAPTLVIVSGDEKAIAPQVDCALAGENMLLAATAMDIGSCWIGITEYLFNSPDGNALKVELGIPEGYKPLYSMIFGYASGELPDAAERKEGNINIIK